MLRYSLLVSLFDVMKLKHLIMLYRMENYTYLYSNSTILTVCACTKILMILGVCKTMEDLLLNLFFATPWNACYRI